MTTLTDETAMRLALDQAQNAWLAGEVPVGAIIVRDDEHGVPRVVATGYNRPITSTDPTAHAEVVALRQAADLAGNYRLPECTLYVTLEPCPMCAMALLHARFKRVVFGAPDPKTGAAGSVVDLFGVAALNHHTAVQGGCLEEACAMLLRDFFAERRAEHKVRAAARAAGPQAGPDASSVEAALAAADPSTPPAASLEAAASAGLPGEAAVPAADPIPVGLAVEIDLPDAAFPRTAG